MSARWGDLAVAKFDRAIEIEHHTVVDEVFEALVSTYPLGAESARWRWRMKAHTWTQGLENALHATATWWYALPEPMRLACIATYVLAGELNPGHACMKLLKSYVQDEP